MTATLCACGCGQPTLPAKTTSTRSGSVKGQPNRFLRGHTFGPAGVGHVRWRGGVTTRPDGYRAITTHADRPSKQEHVDIAERVLGRRLAKGEQVHHVNRVRADNSRGNLVLCESTAYHQLLHRRQRALDTCGDANAHRCIYCGGYGHQADITIENRKDRRFRAYHKLCNANQAKLYRAARAG